MRGPRVDDVMNRPPYMIPENATGAQALREMEAKGVKKILVRASDDTYKGVLERWKVTKIHLDEPVGNLELSPFHSVPLGTPLSALETLLIDLPSVYVHAPKDPGTLVGVVTGYDIMKAF